MSEDLSDQLDELFEELDMERSEHAREIGQMVAGLQD